MRRETDPGGAKRLGFKDIASVRTPDAQTIVLKYKKPFHSYKLQFRNGVLPRHVRANDSGYPAAGLPTMGPFVIEAWVDGEHVRLQRNPYFHEPGKPYLDAIRIIFRNDVELMRQMVLARRADICPWLTQPHPEQLRELVEGGLRIGSGSTFFFNRFQLNLRDPQDPARAHPVLGDIRVRRAIVMGTDVREVTANWRVPGIHEPTYLNAC